MQPILNIQDFEEKNLIWKKLKKFKKFMSHLRHRTLKKI